METAEEKRSKVYKCTKTKLAFSLKGLPHRLAIWREYKRCRLEVMSMEQCEDLMEWCHASNNQYNSIERGERLSRRREHDGLRRKRETDKKMQ